MRFRPLVFLFVYFVLKLTRDIQDQEWTGSYRLETAAKLRQVEELSDPEHPKVFHVTRCSQCGGQLDLPSVHFMCNHSYHQRCVPTLSRL